VPDPIKTLEYVRAHLEDALATDGRVAQQGLCVEIDGDVLVITGSVPAEERCRAVAEVAEEVAAGFRVRNEVEAVALAQPSYEAVVDEEATP
jgi:hypothetical protein